MQSKRFGDLVLIAVWVVANLVSHSAGIAHLGQDGVGGAAGAGAYRLRHHRCAVPNKQLGKAERLLFVITLSSAASALGGILLNLTATGLRQNTWLAYLCAVTLMACAVALGRRVYAARRASRCCRFLRHRRQHHHAQRCYTEWCKAACLSAPD